MRRVELLSERSVVAADDSLEWTWKAMLRSRRPGFSLKLISAEDAEGREVRRGGEGEREDQKNNSPSEPRLKLETTGPRPVSPSSCPKKEEAEEVRRVLNEESVYETHSSSSDPPCTRPRELKREKGKRSALPSSRGSREV